MSFFVPTTIDHEGRALELSLAELEPIAGRGNDWHGERDPSTWLVVAVLQAARAKYPGVPDGPLLALAAGALGITVDALRSAIAWHENYMRWHDGDDSYRVL